MPQTSPKNTPCLYCGKLFTQKGIWSHEQYACKKSPHRKKRVFGKKRCAVCGKSFHAAGLRSHMATQHPREFAVEKNRKPTSRSARRREMLAHAEKARAKRDSLSPRERSRDSRLHRTTHSPQKTKRADEPRHSGKQLAQSKGATATDRAWAKMEQKMTQAANK